MTVDDYIKIASAIIGELFLGLFTYKFVCGMLGLTDDPQRIEVELKVTFAEPEE